MNDDKTAQTAFRSLPVPRDGNVKFFNIPQHFLDDDAIYEFRVGQQLPTHSMFSDILTTRTMSADAASVSNLKAVASTQSVTVSWTAPRFTVGMIGYRVELLQCSPQSGCELIDSRSLSVSTVSVEFGCGSVRGCLVPHTAYEVRVNVVRDDVQMNSVSSKQFVTSSIAHSHRFDRSSANKAEMSAVFFALGSTITLTFTSPVPQYNNTPLSQTILFPFALLRAQQNISQHLTDSIVSSSSNTTLVVTLSDHDFNDFEDSVFDVDLPFSRLQFQFGANAETVDVRYYCLIDRIIDAFLLLSDFNDSRP
jgi:hypothetical protein